MSKVDFIKDRSVFAKQIKHYFLITLIKLNYVYLVFQTYIYKITYARHIDRHA